MTKAAALRALQSLEGLAVVNWEATAKEKEQAKADARRVRRFIDAQRKRIVILQNYVLLGAECIEDGVAGSDRDSILAEMRAAAKPKATP